MLTVIGVDLAGVWERDTGFCILRGMEAVTCVMHRDEEIIVETLKVKPSVVAVDAPLFIPRGRQSIQDRSGPHLRHCDRDLLKMGIKFFPVTLGPMRKLAERGMRLREVLEGYGLEVVEVYPGGAQDLLKIPRGKKDVDGLKRCLEGIGVKGLSAAVSIHELDAVTSAYTGKLYLEKRYIALGDPGEGLMIMPKPENRVSSTNDS